MVESQALGRSLLLEVFRDFRDLGRRGGQQAGPLRFSGYETDVGHFWLAGEIPDMPK